VQSCIPVGGQRGQDGVNIAMAAHMCAGVDQQQAGYEPGVSGRQSQRDGAARWNAR
jgi:hypothetical protein